MAKPEQQQEEVVVEIVLPLSLEEEIEDFKAVVASQVESGMITRVHKEGDYGFGLDEIKDHLRPIAEAELERQGK